MNHSIIIQSLKDLASKRPFFWSEADFQFAFSEVLRIHLPNAKIRLERPFPISDEKYYHVDIWVEDDGKVYPIELKYKTKKCSVTVEDEIIQVTEQSAIDLGRYDYVADIKRIEDIRDKDPLFGEGYAIILTNDASYYTDPEETINTMDSEFRIHEGAKLSGELRWRCTSKAKKVDENGNRDSRKAITLSDSYTMNWNLYSIVQNKNGITIPLQSCVTIIKNNRYIVI